MSMDGLESGLIDFKCPYCSSPLAFHKNRVGTVEECPVCFKVVVVPSRGSETGGKFPVPIETPRLRIRFLRTEDQPDWLECVTDKESYQYLHGQAPDENEARAWFLSSRTKKLTDPDGYISLGIQLRDSSKLIGSISFYLYGSESEPVRHRQAGFQIMISPAFRSRGYGSEAVAGLLQLAFTGIRLHDVRVGIDTRNRAARRMAEKAGMKLEGEFAEDRYIKDEWVSTAWYRLLRNEYLK